MNSAEYKIMAQIQQALLGEVSSSLRAVAYSYGETSIHLDCYFDGLVSEDDRESMSCVETELIASFPENFIINVTVHRIDLPQQIPKDKPFAFLRREG